MRPVDPRTRHRQYLAPDVRDAEPDGRAVEIDQREHCPVGVRR